MGNEGHTVPRTSRSSGAVPAIIPPRTLGSQSLLLSSLVIQDFFNLLSEANIY